jgi:hypothetical protein
MVSFSGRFITVLALFMTLSMVTAQRAAAQSSNSAITFSGGGSIDPEQVYVGVAWESPDIGGRFRLRPGLDGGFGDGLRLATFNLDLMVKFPLGTTGWSLLQGGGPVITVSKLSDDIEGAGQELHAGGSYLFGFQHDNGFFTEFRVGGGGFTPQLKIGVGWAVEIK